MRITYEPRKFFIEKHASVNQTYDDKFPYSLHLDGVAAAGKRFKHLLDISHPKRWEMILAALYGHDVIEDARTTYNEVKEVWGERIADMIFLCTEYRGRNPDERKPIIFYQDLAKDTDAAFVKLCDIIANTTYSLYSSNTNMFNKHQKVYVEKVRPYMYVEQLEPMYEYLEGLHALNTIK